MPSAKLWTLRKLLPFAVDTAAVNSAAAKFGLESVAKSTYACSKAFVWAQQHPNKYDHVLAYWGNYAATCAYIYHRLSGAKNPFSIFLHATADLYRNPIYMRRKLLHADQIITCSDFNRDFIAQSFPDISDRIKSKIYVHYHGMNFSDMPMTVVKPTHNRLVAVGRFVKLKGFDYLLRAVHLLKSRGTAVDVELIGDGSEAENLRSLAHELGIEDSIKFAGWLPADHVPAAISRATILVHPSLEDGVPNVIKEAMAVGIPVVASNIAGIPEMLDNGKNGILIPPKRLDLLVSAIGLLLSDEKLRRTYAERGRQYAEENFDMWKNGQRLAELFGSGCERHGAAVVNCPGAVGGVAEGIGALPPEVALNSKAPIS